MKFIVVANLSSRHSMEEIQPHLETEAKKALQLVAEDFVREIYSRTDGKGAILIVEAADESEVRRRLGELPLAERGMLSFDIYGTKPYRGIAALAQK